MSDLGNRTTEAEIPWNVSMEIASWQRIIDLSDNPSTRLQNYRTAVRELGARAKVSPEARHVIQQALSDIAADAGIDTDVNEDIDTVADPRGRDDDAWQAPEPIKAILPPVKELGPEMLPDAIRDFVVDVSNRQQAPADFVAVTALCAISAVIGNRVRVRPKQHDDWEVVPNLWGAIIGRPSSMKSSAMKAALAPVYAIQDIERGKWEQQSEAAKIDGALCILETKNKKRKAEKELKAGNRDEARDILANMMDDPDELPCPRIVVNDATIEKIGELLNENPRGLLLIRDELVGLLSKLEREEYQSDRAFFLEAYNGDGPFTYDRIGRGTVHIKHCTLGIIGGVQPARLAPIVRGAVSGVSNDGFVQRLQMAVYPDDDGSWEYIDRKPDPAARLAYEKVFRDLYELSLGDTDNPAILHFSPESQALFRQWMEEVNADARSGSLPSVLESHLLKMPETVASLALIFELIDGGRCEVTEISMRRALDWADHLRSHANRLYALGDAMAADGARLIVHARACDTLFAICRRAFSRTCVDDRPHVRADRCCCFGDLWLVRSTRKPNGIAAPSRSTRRCRTCAGRQDGRPTIASSGRVLPNIRRRYRRRELRLPLGGLAGARWHRYPNGACHPNGGFRSAASTPSTGSHARSFPFSCIQAGAARRSTSRRKSGDAKSGFAEKGRATCRSPREGRR
jgi:Protein of unknown function (DUF3987)